MWQNNLLPMGFGDATLELTYTPKGTKPSQEMSGYHTTSYTIKKVHLS